MATLQEKGSVFSFFFLFFFFLFPPVNKSQADKDGFMELVLCFKFHSSSYNNYSTDMLD